MGSFEKIGLDRPILKRLFSQKCPLARGATYDGWTAHMFLYQDQMRNLGQKEIIQGTPQQLDYGVSVRGVSYLGMF